MRGDALGASGPANQRSRSSEPARTGTFGASKIAFGGSRPALPPESLPLGDRADVVRDFVHRDSGGHRRAPKRRESRARAPSRSACRRHEVARPSAARESCSARRAPRRPRRGRRASRRRGRDPVPGAGEVIDVARAPVGGRRAAGCCRRAALHVVGPRLERRHGAGAASVPAQSAPSPAYATIAVAPAAASAAAALLRSVHEPATTAIAPCTADVSGAAASPASTTPATPSNARDGRVQVRWPAPRAGAAPRPGIGLGQQPVERTSVDAAAGPLAAAARTAGRPRRRG